MNHCSNNNCQKMPIPNGYDLCSTCIKKKSSKPAGITFIAILVIGLFYLYTTVENVKFPTTSASWLKVKPLHQIWDSLTYISQNPTSEWSLVKIATFIAILAISAFGAVLVRKLIVKRNFKG